MKTWEKVYWGIILVFLGLMIVGIIAHKGDIPVKTTIGNRTTINHYSKWKVLGIALLVWLGLFGLIWLIAKFVTGGFSKKS